MPSGSGKGVRGDLKPMALHLLQCKILCQETGPLALFVLWSSLVLVSDVLNNGCKLVRSFHLTGVVG